MPITVASRVKAIEKEERKRSYAEFNNASSQQAPAVKKSSFLSRIPIAAKIGLGIIALSGLYFAFFNKSNNTKTIEPDVIPTSVE